MKEYHYLASDYPFERMRSTTEGYVNAKNKKNALKRLKKMFKSVIILKGIKEVKNEINRT